MSKTRVTVVADVGGRRHKLFKVWFGPDGSYYVTAPYHTAKTASFFKRTARYGTPFGKMTVSSPETTDVAILDDDDGRLKFAHHPDGFCQFSGHGIVSGKDVDEKIKGIGVFARALRAIGPKFGPVFGVVVYGIADFDVCEGIGPHDVLFRIDDLAPPVVTPIASESGDEEPAPPLPRVESLWIEGFYFQPAFRRFISREGDGSLRMFMPHPTGIVIPLRVVLAPDTCALPGFIGLYACREMVAFGAESGFSINGPAENYREDAFGRRLGDVIACYYPRLPFLDGRSLRYSATTAEPASQEFGREAE